MPSVEELLSVAEVDANTRSAMDSRIEIDADTRIIRMMPQDELFGVESDEKSERKYFKVHKIVGNGVDLSKLQLRINYQNASKIPSGKDMYIVTDATVYNDEWVYFSWELSRKVTQYKGSIYFIVCAIKADSNGNITNEWNTTLAEGKVLEGLEVETNQEQQYQASDYLEQLKQQLLEYSQEIKDTFPSDYTQIQDDIGSLKEDLGYTNDSVIEFLKGAERIVKTNWTQGRIDKNTGKFGISGSEIVTDYIQCHGDEIIIKTLKPNYTIYKFKYDLDGTYIESDIGNYPRLRITNDGYKYRFQANSINSVEIPTPENITSIVTINENLNLPYALKNQFWDNKKTEDISYANLGNYSVSPDGAATSPAPDKIAINFDAVKDERYVFTISEGYYFILGYNGFQTKHNRKVLILTSPITGKLRMAIGKTDGSNFSDLDECKFTAQKMVFRNNSHEYDFIIAGKNATSYHKSISDVVCDGTNDEDLLTACCNGNILVSQHTKILVYGDICINKFVECYNGLIKGRGFNAIQIQMSHIKTDSSSFYDQHHIVSLNGINNFNNSGYHSKIYVTENCYNTISPTKEDEYSIIGGIRQQSTSSMGDYWFKLGLEINNIDVSPYGLEKPICCIDGSGFSEMRIDGVQVRPYITATIRHGMYNVPDGLIGIRGIHGSNIGCNNYIKRTRIIGMYEGLALTGEHFICEDILMHTCVYGLTIGNYKVTPEMQHPNVFIGCSIEQCKRFGILNRYGATEESEQKYGPLQTVIMIGTSTEPNYTDIDGVNHDTLPFKEIVKGVYSGRIEMDKFTNGRIFEDESGRNILCVNTKHGICGEFNSRPKSSNSEFGAKYYAIDTNTTWEMTHSGWKQIN